MYLLGLIESIRVRLDDQGGDAGTIPAGYYAYWQYDDTSCLWKNKELVGYLKAALLEVAGRAPWTAEGTIGDHLGVPTRLTVKALNPEITLHISTLAIEQVRLVSSGLILTKATSSQLEKIGGDEWATLTGVPTHYVEPIRGLIRLYPIPSSADEVRLVVRRRTLDEFEWTDVATEEAPYLELSDIPEDLREALVVGVCKLAYLKNDADTINIQLSQEYERQFTAMVGPVVSWRQKEARRENANLNVQIHGYGYTRNKMRVADTEEDW